ncbi:MAG: mechanosensitive ion channel family protein [Acidobacteriota bacterium]
MNGTFYERLLFALDQFFESIMRFLPGLLAALLILVMGAVIAWLVKLALARILAVARFDRFCDSWGASQVLGRAELRTAPSALLASLCFWLLFLSFAMAGLSALHVDVVNQLIAQFFLYLPRLFAALLIVLAGVLLGSFLSRAALLAAVNAGVPSPRAISLVVKLLVSILAFAMALEQLQIAKSIVLAAFIITFGATMLALALAFGIGGRDVARRVLERQFLDGEAGREPDPLSHV